MARKSALIARPRAWICAGLLAAAAAPACATSMEPRRLTLPADGVRPVTRVGMIVDERTAVASIGAVLQRDLGLPSFPVTFVLYPHAGAFEQALLDSNYDPALARSTAKTMAAVGGHQRVLINGGMFDAMNWAERVMLLAHELGHSLQYELAGGRRGTSDQWLREGFADWLAVQVLERLDAAPAGAVRQQRLREVSGAGPARVLPLSTLVTFPQWVAAGEQRGLLPYLQAFVATDLLIDRHGAQAVLDYFARFATSEDRAANFEAAFGETVERFEASLHAHLWRE